jgi:transcriptional regulator with XRE-family HTH domain
MASLTHESNLVKKAEATPGGNRLRALREDYARTQMDVELDASLGIGYLQRVESGKVRYPERDTLERILGALNAPYTERRDILELFGYVVDTPLPDAREIEAAVGSCQSELASAVFPVYLLDCAHRLLSWNPFLPKLFGGWQKEHDVSVLRLMFDPAYGVSGRIANPDAFFPAQIRALRYQMRLFRSEAWVDVLLADLLRQAMFARYWTAAPEQPSGELIAARPLIPLELNVPDTGLLRFRLTSEPFADDRRFRMIYYLPADAATMQQCLVWFGER